MSNILILSLVGVAILAILAGYYPHSQSPTPPPTPKTKQPTPSSSSTWKLDSPPTYIDAPSIHECELATAKLLPKHLVTSYCTCAASNPSSAPLPADCLLRSAVSREAVMIIGQPGTFKTTLSNLLLNNDASSTRVDLEHLKKPFTTCPSEIRCSRDIFYAYSPFGFFVIDTPGLEESVLNIDWLIKRLNDLTTSTVPLKITHLIIVAGPKFRIPSVARTELENARRILKSLNNAASVTLLWNKFLLQEDLNLDSKIWEEVKGFLGVPTRRLITTFSMLDTPQAVLDRAKLLAELHAPGTWFQKTATATQLFRIPHLAIVLRAIDRLVESSTFLKSSGLGVDWAGIPNQIVDAWVIPKVKKPIRSNPVVQFCNVRIDQTVLKEFDQEYEIRLNPTTNVPLLVEGIAGFLETLNLCELSVALHHEWNAFLKLKADFKTLNDQFNQQTETYNKLLIDSQEMERKGHDMLKDQHRQIEEYNKLVADYLHLKKKGHDMSICNALSPLFDQYLANYDLTSMLFLCHSHTQVLIVLIIILLSLLWFRRPRRSKF